jgi:vitamin B12 transporter
MRRRVVRVLVGVFLLGGGARARAEGAEEVTIQGRTTVARGTREPHAAVSVIEGAQLAAPGMKATDVLKLAPGVQVQESGGFGAPATASVRGATAQQTPVYLAGVRLNDDVGGIADLSTIPLWMVRRVEVYRGHAPLSADRLGIGGAIFFDPRRPGRTEVGGGATLGSYGARGGFVYAGVGGPRGAGLVGVATSAAKNDFPYVDDRGTLFDPGDDQVVRRTNSDTASVDGWGIGRVRLPGQGTLDLVVNAFHREQGAPRLALLPSRAARARTDRRLAATLASLPIAEGARIEVKTSVLLVRSVYLDPQRELSFYTGRVQVDGSRVEQGLAVPVELSERWQLRPALDVAVERIGRDEQGSASTRGRRLFSRGGLGAEWSPGANLQVRGVVAGECHGIQQEAASCDLQGKSGRISAAYQRGRVTFLASAGRYVRVPSLGELIGVSEVVRGNRELRPETARSLEAGFRGDAPSGGLREGLSFELFGFVRWVEDLVAYQRAAQGYVIPYNVEQARVLGGETSGGVRPVRWLFLGGSVALLDGRDTSPARRVVNDVLPFRARFVALARLRFESEKLPLRVPRAVALELRHNHQSSRYADRAGLVVLPAQQVSDAELDLLLDEGCTHLRLRASNLFDARRFDVVGYPLPGRTLFASLEVTL